MVAYCVLLFGSEKPSWSETVYFMRGKTFVLGGISTQNILVPSLYF